MIDFYGTKADYIHLKFGRMHKAYNFTNEFRRRHQSFCEEYEKYWNNDKDCRFNNPLEIAQYVDVYDIPVKFYYNMSDTPSKSIADVYEYLIREYAGISQNADGSYRSNSFEGLDGEKGHNSNYKVLKEDE